MTLTETEKQIALRVAKEMRASSEYTVLDLVCNAEEFASRLLDEIRKSAEPFCYMSETYEVGLFSSPPDDGDFEDMFPVFRHPPAPQPDLQDEAREVTAKLRVAATRRPSINDFCALAEKAANLIEKLEGI